MCPEFSDFLANKDKFSKAKDPENMEVIEHYFNPNNASCSSYICNEVIDDPKDDKFSKYSHNILILPLNLQGRIGIKIQPGKLVPMPALYEKKNVLKFSYRAL